MTVHLALEAKTQQDADRIVAGVIAE